MGFQGSWTDPATAKVSAQARWYTPATGGFISRDSAQLPLTSAVSANRYTYANANPLTYSDPSGHNAAVIGGEVGCAVGGLFGCVVGLVAGAVVTAAVAYAADRAIDHVLDRGDSRGASVPAAVPAVSSVSRPWVDGWSAGASLSVAPALPGGGSLPVGGGSSGGSTGKSGGTSV
ncbi:RHS repeat-associated core domain-containing protein, partial [Frankia sp. CiP1_Cm_nod2]|uniref:RHS repeat-associated core domain-containing protein n=1 Tax=Frankia sp. CiP1_Cm_nod2 TaxID=2897161 RepID=UPI004044E287